MADQTLTSLAINSLLIGLLALGLISAYVLIVNSEGRESIFDGYSDIEGYNLNMTSVYTNGKILETANVNSNISAGYNTELSQSGGDNSGNAMAINLQNIISLTWTTLGFLGLILFGSIYTLILSSLVISVISYLTVAYIIKALRTGET